MIGRLRFRPENWRQLNVTSRWVSVLRRANSFGSGAALQRPSSGGMWSWLGCYRLLVARLPRRSTRHANQALSLAHEVGDSPSIVFALVMRAQVHQVMREVAPALETAEAAIAMAEKDGFPFFRVLRGNRKGLGSRAA